MANEVRIEGLKNISVRLSAFKAHVRKGSQEVTVSELFKIDTQASHQAPRKTTNLIADIHVEMAANKLSGAVISGLKALYAIFQHHGTMRAGAASAPRGVPTSAYSTRPGGIRANKYLLDAFDDRVSHYFDRLKRVMTDFR